MVCETEMGDFVLMCVHCGDTGPVGESVGHARDLASDDGWSVDDESLPEDAEDLCGECRLAPVENYD